MIFVHPDATILSDVSRFLQLWSGPLSVTSKNKKMLLVGIERGLARAQSHSHMHTHTHTQRIPTVTCYIQITNGHKLYSTVYNESTIFPRHPYASSMTSSHTGAPTERSCLSTRALHDSVSFPVTTCVSDLIVHVTWFQHK